MAEGRATKWRRSQDPFGNVYFFHKATREVQWELPAAHAAMEEIPSRNRLAPALANSGLQPTNHPPPRGQSGQWAPSPEPNLTQTPAGISFGNPMASSASSAGSNSSHAAGPAQSAVFEFPTPHSVDPTTVTSAAQHILLRLVRLARIPSETKAKQMTTKYGDFLRACHTHLMQSGFPVGPKQIVPACGQYWRHLKIEMQQTFLKLASSQASELLRAMEKKAVVTTMIPHSATARPPNPSQPAAHPAVTVLNVDETSGNTSLSGKTRLTTSPEDRSSSELPGHKRKAMSADDMREYYRPSKRAELAPKLLAQTLPQSADVVGAEGGVPGTNMAAAAGLNSAPGITMQFSRSDNYSWRFCPSEDVDPPPHLCPPALNFDGIKP